MAGLDHCYEFNAPKHFFDFTKGDIEVDEAYFDTVSETPQKTLMSTKTVHQTSPKTASAAVAGCQPSPKTSTTPEAGCQPSPKTSTTPEAGCQPSPKTSATPEAGCQQSPEAAAVHETVCQLSARRKAKRIVQTLAGLDTVGVRHSPRLAAIAKALRRSKASIKSIGRPKRNSRLHEANTTRKRVVRQVSGVMGLSAQDEADLQTIANVSHKTSRESTSSKPLSPTVHDDNRPQDLNAEATFPAPPPARPPHTSSVKPKTTNSRVKSRELAQGEEQEYVDFPKLLRSNTTTLNRDAAMSRTVPQPFNLTESRRGKTEEPRKFVSVAELNLMFHTKTPQRFRSKRTEGEIYENAKRVKVNPPSITVPHTPQLTTSTRARTANCLSREQLELKAFEEAQKQVFKAKPVNKKVLEGPLAIHMLEKKPPTVPEPFNITDTRKAKATEGIKMEAVDKEGNELQSLEWKRSATKVQPFSFDSRDKAKMQQKQDKIKKVIEEEKSLAEFHARPMPAFEGGVLGVPPKKPPTPTQPQPFNLQADLRGTVKQEKFKAQLEEESHLEVEQRKFHAQPSDVVNKAPFVPEKSKRPLTEISSLTLNTEVRAGKRSEFELQRKMHEEEVLAVKKQEEERRAAEEVAEINRLRQNAVHKANPAPKFKPVTLQLPPCQVTIPKTPKFATDSRLRSRSQADSTQDISSATYTAE